MNVLGFTHTEKDGEFENSTFVVSDLKPKNVLCANDDDIFVIDAEVMKK